MLNKPEASIYVKQFVLSIFSYYFLSNKTSNKTEKEQTRIDTYIIFISA